MSMSMFILVSCASSMLGGMSLGSGHLLSGLLLETLVRVVILELTEANELVTVVTGDEDLRIVDHENEAVSLLDGDAGDTTEGLHSELSESLAALLLTSVEFGTIYYVNSMLVSEKIDAAKTYLDPRERASLLLLS